MRNVVQFLFFTSLCAISALAVAEPTSFGNRVLEIPAPTGYVAVSDMAPTFFAMVQNYMPPANRLVEFYVPPEDADALANEEEDMALERYFQLMDGDSSDTRVVTPARFKQLVDALEEEAASTDLDRRVDALTSKGNAENERALGLDPKLAVSDTAVLGIYRREPWGIFVAARSSASAGEDPASDKMVSAGVFMLVGQKVLFLIAWSPYSDAKDLAWTKNAVGAWVQAIRAANPDQAS